MEYDSSKNSKITFQYKFKRKKYIHRLSVLNFLSIIQTLRLDFEIPDDEIIFGFFHSSKRVNFLLPKFSAELIDNNKSTFIIITKPISDLPERATEFVKIDSLETLFENDDLNIIESQQNNINPFQNTLLFSSNVNYYSADLKDEPFVLSRGELFANQLKPCVLNDIIFHIDVDTFLNSYLQKPGNLIKEFKFLFPEKNEKTILANFLPQKHQTNLVFMLCITSFFLFYKGLITIDELSLRIVSIFYYKSENDISGLFPVEMNELSQIAKRHSNQTIYPTSQKSIDRKNSLNFFKNKQNVIFDNNNINLAENTIKIDPIRHAKHRNTEKGNIFSNTKLEGDILIPPDFGISNTLLSLKNSNKRYSAPENFPKTLGLNSRKASKNLEETFNIDNINQPSFMTETQPNFARQSTIKTEGSPQNSPENKFGTINNQFYNLNIKQYFQNSKISIEYHEPIATLLEKIVIEKDFVENDFHEIALFICNNFELFKESIIFYNKTKSTLKITEILAKNDFKNMTENLQNTLAENLKKIPKIEFVKIKKFLEKLFLEDFISEFLHDQIYDLVLQNSLIIIGVFEVGILTLDYNDTAESLNIAYDYFFSRSINSMSTLTLEKKVQNKDFEDILEAQKNILKTYKNDLTLNEFELLSKTIDKKLFLISYAHSYYQNHKDKSKFIASLQDYCHNLNVISSKNDYIESGILKLTDDCDKLQMYIEKINFAEKNNFLESNLDFYVSRILQKEPNIISICQVYSINDNIRDFSENLSLYFRIISKNPSSKKLFEFMESENIKPEGVIL